MLMHACMCCWGEVERDKVREIERERDYFYFWILYNLPLINLFLNLYYTTLILTTVWHILKVIGEVVFVFQKHVGYYYIFYLPWEFFNHLVKFLKVFCWDLFWDHIEFMDWFWRKINNFNIIVSPLIYSNLLLCCSGNFYRSYVSLLVGIFSLLVASLNRILFWWPFKIDYC